MNTVTKTSIWVIVLVIAGGALWYFVSPFFIRTHIDEALPPALQAQKNADDTQMQTDSPSPSASAQSSGETKEATAEQGADTTEEESEESNNNVSNEATEANAANEAAQAPVLISQGEFQDADNFHRGSGTVHLYQMPDGSHFLRLENFSVTNGPDLRVLLVTHPDPKNRSDVGSDYLELGKLKATNGNQNYTVPAGTDISGFQSVIVYCKPFHVVFTKARLQ